MLSDLIEPGREIDMAGEPEDLAVEIPPESQAVADELVRAVRSATRDLPFHLEPSSFLVALEDLGADEAQ